MRILLASLCFLSILLTPWWITILLMGGLSARYRAWEVLIFGLIMDFAWVPFGFSHLPIFMLASIVIVWVFEPIREQFFM
jgi:hypothetical protein